MSPLRPLAAEDLVGGSANWVGLNVGITGLATAAVLGRSGAVFVKWPTNDRGEAAFRREVAVLQAWPGAWPTNAPTLRAVVELAEQPFLAFDFVPGRTSWEWTAATTTSAFAVLDELQTLSSIGPLSRSNMVDPDRYIHDGRNEGLPSRLLSDVGVFARELHDLSETFCHGDAHPENWVVRPDGCAALVDYEHAGGGPAGWDRALLSALLPGDLDVRAEWATRYVSSERSRILVATVTAKCVARALSRPTDRLGRAAPGALQLWETLARDS